MKELSKINFRLAKKIGYTGENFKHNLTVWLKKEKNITIDFSSFPGRYEDIQIQATVKNYNTHKIVKCASREDFSKAWSIGISKSLQLLDNDK